MSHAPSVLGSSKAMQAGSVAVTPADAAVPVTFAVPMPSASYEVFLQVKVNAAVVLWPSAITTAGFTANLSVGIAGTISYLAVEN